MPPRRRLASARPYLFVGLAIAVFMVCLISACSRLVEIEREMEHDIGENVFWFVSQAQSEALRFADTLSRYGAGDETASLEEVGHRFDMLVSRLAVFKAGEPRRRLEEATGGGAAGLIYSAETLVGLEINLATLQPGDTAGARRVRETVEPLIVTLREAAGRTMLAEQERALDQRDRRQRTLLQILGYVLGLMASGALLSFRLIRGIRQIRKTEASLRREKDFSELLLNTSREGILAFDRDLRCTLWNPGLENIFGVPRARVMRAALPDAVPFFNEPPVRDALRRTIQGQDIPVEEHDYETTAGAAAVIETSFSPLRDEGGGIVGGLAFVRDTTERRNLEEALRQSQKMEAVGQLTGSVAHDFNNLLTVIAGNLNLLRGKIVNEPRLRRLVDDADQAATRAEGLIQQLLAFSRKQRLQPGPIDLTEVVLGVQDLLQQTLGPNARLCFSLAEDLPLALADRNQLEVALLNLVINARDAMPNGGGVITIETSRATLSADELAGAAEAEAGPFVRLSVRDTGTGIPRAALARIFEPFFTTKPAGAGTGLGLSMVYGFVRQSNGHVRVDSREGDGTTFDLFLPLAAAIAAAENQPAEEARREATGTGAAATPRMTAPNSPR